MKFQSLTIRTRLILLTLAVAIPLLFAGLINLWSLWQAARAQLDESIIQQAKLASWAFEQRLSAQRATLQTIAMMAGKNRDRSLLNDYLDSIVKTRPNWLDVSIIAGNGEVVLSQSYKAVNLPVISVESLKQSARGDDSLIVLIEPSRAVKPRLLTLALPLANENFIVARIDGASVNDVFDNLDIPAEHIITVLDRNNHLLWRNRIAPEKIAIDVSHSPPIADARRRGEGTYEFQSEYDDVWRVYGFTKLKTIDGIVAVGVPSQKFYAPARELLARQLLFSFTFTTLAISAAYLLARSIARPLSGLTVMARAFGAGDLTARAATENGGSIRELEITFNQMAEEIVAREEKLHALDRLKSQFVSNVSHELRTPLTTIKTLTRVLQRSKISASEREEFLETIAIECDRQIEFVQNLLDLSRIEAGAYRMSLAPTDTIKTLWEAIEAEQRTAILKKLRLRFKPPPEGLPFAITDNKALRRVVLSLVENAIKYTPENGEITISVSRVAARIQIEVADDGCGICADDVPHIFEKFYRGRPLAAGCSADAEDGQLDEDDGVSEARGVGLGLYLVANLIEQINGEITVESPLDKKNGRGTKFTILLPIAD